MPSLHDFFFRICWETCTTFYKTSREIVIRKRRHNFLLNWHNILLNQNGYTSGSCYVKVALFTQRRPHDLFHLKSDFVSSLCLLFFLMGPDTGGKQGIIFCAQWAVFTRGQRSNCCQHFKFMENYATFTSSPPPPPPLFFSLFKITCFHSQFKNEMNACPVGNGHNIAGYGCRGF